MLNWTFPGKDSLFIKQIGTEGDAHQQIELYKTQTDDI